jgi:hypothetical protein
VDENLHRPTALRVDRLTFKEPIDASRWLLEAAVVLIPIVLVDLNSVDILTPRRRTGHRQLNRTLRQSQAPPL